MALILSFMIFFSSIQEGTASILGGMIGMSSCCSTELVQDETCKMESDLDTDLEVDKHKCCEGTQCDCTCCVHLPLFNFGEFEFSWDYSTVKETHSFSNHYQYSNLYSIFHPPLS